MAEKESLGLEEDLRIEKNTSIQKAGVLETISRVIETGIEKIDVTGVIGIKIGMISDVLGQTKEEIMMMIMMLTVRN